MYSCDGKAKLKCFRKNYNDNDNLVLKKHFLLLSMKTVVLHNIWKL